MQVEGNPHAQGPCGEGHSRCGQGGEDIAAAGKNPGRDTELVQQEEAAYSPTDINALSLAQVRIQDAGTINSQAKMSFSTTGSGDGR